MKHLRSTFNWYCKQPLLRLHIDSMLCVKLFFNCVLVFSLVFLDSSRDYEPLPTKGKLNALDFDTLLKQAQQNLRR